MDAVGVINYNHQMKREKHAKKRREKALKVVYISSPMKVKTSASQFRALVQELTGRESDVARLMETDNHHHHHHDYSSRSWDHHGFKHVDEYNHAVVPATTTTTTSITTSNNNNNNHNNTNKVVPITALLDPRDRDSPTSSESLLEFEAFDDVFAPQVMDHESFTGLMFPSGFLYESSQADFLRSFDVV